VALDESRAIQNPDVLVDGWPPEPPRLGETVDGNRLLPEDTNHLAPVTVPQCGEHTIERD
jgi:hypothetical protein